MEKLTRRTMLLVAAGAIATVATKADAEPESGSLSKGDIDPEASERCKEVLWQNLVEYRLAKGQEVSTEQWRSERAILDRLWFHLHNEMPQHTNLVIVTGEADLDPPAMLDPFGSGKTIPAPQKKKLSVVWHPEVAADLEAYLGVTAVEGVIDAIAMEIAKEIRLEMEADHVTTWVWHLPPHLTPSVVNSTDFSTCRMLVISYAKI